MELRKQDNRRDMVMVDMDQLVPKDHLLRKIEKVIDYDWLYERLSPYYSYVDRSEQLSLFVKPSNHEHKKRKYKNDIGRRENMAYDAEKDEYACEQGKKLHAAAVKNENLRQGMSRN